MKLIIFMLLALFMGAANAETSYEDAVNRLSSSLDVSHDVSERYLEQIAIHIDSLQVAIQDVASHKIKYENKADSIEKIVNVFFEDERSKVQVSSLNSQAFKQYNVKLYLLRLANLSVDNNVTVKISYINSLSLGTVQKTKSGDFELPMYIWQEFEKCYSSEGPCYKDYTHKAVNVLLKPRNENLYMTVKSITVEDTVSWEDFRKKYINLYVRKNR